MTNTNSRVDRSARLAWVSLADMKVSPVAQREKLKAAHVEKIAREFDPDKFDAPKLNLRNGTYWIVDGWHRTEAARLALGEDQLVQCWVRKDLGDADAAEWSLGLNDYRRWSALDTFRTALTAGRHDECDVDRIVRFHGMSVGDNDGSIACVSTLLKVYRRGGPKALTAALHIVINAYGDSGCTVYVIDGISLLCQRYNGAIDCDVAIKKLGGARGGVNGLLGKAQHGYKQRLGSLPHCVAAAAVEIINSGAAGGKKLPVWWKS